MHPKIISVVAHKWFVPAVTGVVSFGGGVAVGYLLGRRETEKTFVEETQLSFSFNEKAEENIQEFKAHSFSDLKASGSTFTIAADDYEKKIEAIKVVEEEKGGEPEPVSIFTETDRDWNYETELSQRDGKLVHVIHRDEFFGDEMGWDSQSTLTWYEKDETLVDERDQVLYNPQQIIGEVMFGHGSGDPNVFYVRNLRLEAEYEVLRDPGSFEMDILGGQVQSQHEQQDLRHSRSPGKFRGD